MFQHVRCQLRDAKPDGEGRLFAQPPPAGESLDLAVDGRDSVNGNAKASGLQVLDHGHHNVN